MQPFESNGLEPLWLRCSPPVVRELLSARPWLRQILGNISWLVGDKVVRLGAGVLINAWIARYLGPAHFGALNIAVALIALVTAFATVGLPDLLIRDLAQHPENRAAILASAFVMRLAGAGAALVFAVGYTAVAHPGDGEALALVIILAAGLFAQAFDVIDQQYQAINFVRAIVLIRNVAFGLACILRVSGIVGHAPVEYFACIATVELGLSALMMLRLAQRHGRSFGLSDFRFDECRRLLHESWPLLARLVAIGAYLSIDQVLIGYFLNPREVGIYAAATRISSIWPLIAVSIMAAVVPRLAVSHAQSSKLYADRLVVVTRALFWLSVAAALVTSLAAAPLIGLLYGRQFLEGAPVLALHAWAGAFSALGVASNAWFINERLTRYGLYQSLISAVVGVGLNLLLIPRLGIMGSAYAMIGSQIVSSFGCNALFKATRPIFRLQVKAVLWL